MRLRESMRLKGLEPLTRSLEGCRSIQLSYRRTGRKVYVAARKRLGWLDGGESNKLTGQT